MQEKIINTGPREKLHSLIPLEEFKAVLSVDDRDEKLCRFCLITSTYTIEQYCMRRFLKKKHFERIEFTGDLFLTLKEYPVNNVHVIYALTSTNGPDGELIESEFYHVLPDCGCGEDMPYTLAFSPALKRLPGLQSISVIYTAGYSNEKEPPDLAAACLELASWNMNRYRGRRIGMTGYIRGTGKEGEHFEMSMPENVKKLLEPYRRKVI